MQSGETTAAAAAAAAAHHYTPPTVPMDLHMPQPFSYYSCIMDNNAVFAAQHAQYGKMYGAGVIDGSGRRAMGDELAAQGSINSRILELRKEKSRDAARSRRGKENYEFYELAKMLPLPNAITSQLDKASIIRLTIAYLRLREFAASGEPSWGKEPQNQKLKASSALRPRGLGNLAFEIFEEHEGTHILQSLDGFAISLNSDGRFLYISETVSIYLGLSQVEMTGSSIFDYVHQSDHEELADQLGVTLAHHQRLSTNNNNNNSDGNGKNSSNSPTNPSTGASPAIPDVCYPVTSLMHAKVDRLNGKPTYDRAFCIRMKSTLTKRGCHFKSSGYRVVLLLGKLRPQFNYSHKKSMPPVMGFIGLAIALPPPSVHEVRLESDMFVTRLTFDFKVAHCEPKVSELLDYTAEELTGQSLYVLCHGEDVHKIRGTHEDLLNKGQVMSNYYRLMNKSGGYTWMQSCATLICNTKNAEEQSIICVNYVLSGPQYSDVVMDQCQVGGVGMETKLKIKQDCDAAIDSSSTGNDYSSNNGQNQRTLNTKYSTTSNGEKGNKKSRMTNSGVEQSNHSHQQQHSQHQDSLYVGNPDETDVRLGQSSYPVTNTTNNREWPFWRPPTLI